MKTLILYYSYKGNSEKAAKELAQKMNDCSLCKIEELKQRSMLSASTSGCLKARFRSASKIHPVSENLQSYDRIIMIAPIWNAYPAPAFNSMVKLLPQGKEVELYFCSAGGDSSKSKEGTMNLIRNMGCKVSDYHDIKTGQSILNSNH